jgi:nucleotide-binding universal stress UspA family protein
VSGTVVVGVDESVGARDALRWGVAEAAIRDAQVLAVLAWGFLDQHTDVLAGFNPEYSAADAEAALGRMIDDALPAEQASLVRRHVVCDLPASALLDSAANADMLVVGARGLGGFGGLLLGSVSQHCVHHATTPTVIVRTGSDTPTSKIVVGIDGSDHAHRALVWAADEARRRHAPLTVVHGYTALPFGAYPYSTMTIDPTLMPHAAANVIKHALAQIDTSGIDTTPVTSPGGAAQAVLEQADDAALVVVGSRGLGALKRLLLGSVATQVVHHASCSVAVIPARD